MTTTPRLGITQWEDGQAMPETTGNEAVRYLEAFAARVAVDKDRTAPAGTESDGDVFIVPASPTGAWAGKADNVAILISTAWVFVAPFAGLTFFVQDEAVNYRYSGSAWAAVVGGGTAASLDYDTDGTLAANSDSKLATQKAVKTFVTAMVTGLADLKGDTDCSANPNYPAGSKGDLYYVTVAGKIGGASGKSVDVGDVYIAKADNAGGTEASVGTSWFVLEHNLTGVITGSTASTTEQLTGTDVSKLSTPDSVAALWEQGSDVASASTVSLGEGGYFNITGTTTITDIDFATDKAGRKAWVKFAGALTLTHNASTLILPTGANIATAAGDTACFVSEGSDIVRCVAYQRASGQPLASAAATPNIQSVTSSATVTPTFSNDQVNITAQAAGLTLANPTGTAVDGWGLSIRIKDNGTARSITFGSQYRAIGVTLPTTTVISKTLYLGMIYNAADTKWDVVAVAQEA